MLQVVDLSTWATALCRCRMPNRAARRNASKAIQAFSTAQRRHDLTGELRVPQALRMERYLIVACLMSISCRQPPQAN